MATSKNCQVTAIDATTIWDRRDASHATLENLGTRVSTYLVPFNFCDCHFFRGYMQVRFRASPNFH